MKAEILGIQDYYPERVVTNKDMEKQLDTTDEWIRERTGIIERRMGEPHETPAFMGAEASKKLLKNLGISANDIDLILVATITPDYHFPATAALVQRSIGANRAWGYDLSAACSGYLYGLETARAFIESGRAKNVLLIAAEKMTSILNPKDRSTYILFGDAGTATLLGPSRGKGEIVDSILKMDGSGVEFLYSPVGGSLRPPTQELIEKGEHFAKQEGKTVFKRAVIDMAEVCAEILEKNHLTGSDIACFVPHQANIRIIDAALERMKMPKEKASLNIDRFGNTTAATIPTAFLDAERKGKIRRGDLVLLASFGAGFTWGSMLVRY